MDEKRRAPAPTIRAIAEQTGFGKSTVSLALRNDPSIPGHTCRLIQSAAQELGYRPNPYVVSLMTHLRTVRGVRTGPTLGIVDSGTKPVRRASDFVLERYVDGAVARARELGFEPDVFWLREPGMTSERMNRIFRTRQVRGLLLLPLPSAQGHVSLDLGNAAAAAVGYSVVRPDVHRACHHNVASITLALRTLRRRGYRRIGLALPKSSDQRTSHLWLSGFLSFQYLFQRTRPVAPLISKPWDETSFLHWFRKQQPDAVVSTSRQIDRWLADAGYEVPGEVGFATLNWLEERPELAGIDQDFESISAAAIDLISGQLQRNEFGIPSAPKTTMLQGRWVEGGTVRPPATP